MLVDLRLSGLGMRHQTPGQLVKDTSLWTLAGFIIVIFSGLLIFSSDPIRYLYNLAFRFKITALAVGIIYNYTIHRREALSKPFSRRVRAWSPAFQFLSGYRSFSAACGSRSSRWRKVGILNGCYFD